MANAVTHLNPNARRMAKSMQNLFGNVARRDTKAAASRRPALVIFPSSDATLQAAITTVLDRLAFVLDPF